MEIIDQACPLNILAPVEYKHLLYNILILTHWY